MGTSNLSPEARKDLITKKAYELYLQRGQTPGGEMEDWLNAEKLVERELQESQGLPRTETSRPSVTPIRTQSPPKVGGFKRASG